MPAPELLERLAGAIVRLSKSEAAAAAEAALAAGLSPYTIIADGLSRGMQTVGEAFRRNEVFIPEVLVACDAYYAGLNVVKPLIDQNDQRRFFAKMVIGTIHGDIHTVGKDVAVPVFQAAGFQVIDLGTAVPDQQFVAAIREHQPELVGLGTYMTATFMHTRATVDAITEAGLRDQVKIICGGPSVDAETARRMGADDASDNAWDAVEKMRALVAALRQEKAARA
ncbi:MAG: cobalamin-binding protein [Armatimonadetes bacterium]|jgi:5-methyltetrahydrofolate--homocysteine methyltransferase|nr:cobalamin-binding protein [Armatimonadota bacterium]